MMTAALALVKPIGMSAADAHAWLATACREVAHIPADILAEACSAARRTCTRHSQVVPAIVREAAQIEARRRAAESARRLAQRHDDQPRAALPLLQADPWRPTAEELGALKAEIERKAKAA